MNISIRSTQTILKGSKIECSENGISKWDNASDSERLNENSNYKRLNKLNDGLRSYY